MSNCIALTAAYYYAQRQQTIARLFFFSWMYNTDVGDEWEMQLTNVDSFDAVLYYIAVYRSSLFIYSFFLFLIL